MSLLSSIVNPQLAPLDITSGPLVFTFEICMSINSLDKYACAYKIHFELQSHITTKLFTIKVEMDTIFCDKFFIT